jgi:hypothetical protein
MSNKHYVGVVRTSYHLLNFLTFLEKNKNIRDVAEVLFTPYWHGTTLSEDLVHYCSSMGIKIIYVNEDILNESISSKIKLCQTELEVVAVSLSTFLLLKILFFKIYKKINVFFIDDGVGSYSGFSARFKALKREKNKFYYSILFPFYYYAQKILNKNIGGRFSMLESPSLNVNKAYRNGIINVLTRLKSNAPKLNKPAVIFCTQPYVDMGVLSISEYKQVLSTLITLCKKNQAELIIRKHPGDKIFDYCGFNTFNNTELFESFLMRNIDYIKSVTSIDSTCLLTSKALFSISAYRVDCSISRFNYGGFSSQLKYIFEKYTKIIHIDAYGEKNVAK